MHRRSAVFVLFLQFTLVSAVPVPAQCGDVIRWLNQTIYVPLYSHIYADDRYRDKPFALTATLSVRNTDQTIKFVLDKVDYYDSDGKLLRSYLKKPLEIKPLASTRFIVRESDNAGGSGAKFLVHWRADTAVSSPIVESVMIGTQMQQGISFISPGRIIDGTISNQD
jgi:hypothetical protein